MKNMIEIYGANEHNLKNIDIKIPKNKLIVFTGLSGSGKSTLAFDTIYAEGQRRYIESLSAYARQFLDKIGKPDVRKIVGLTPAIAIDQKSTSKNPRSTVGTITEIYDYLRLLYARVGVQYCHKCNKKISQMTTNDVINQVLTLPTDTKAILMAPLINSKKGSFVELIENLKSKGYVRAMIDGVMVRLDEDMELSKTKMHTIKVVVDRVVINKKNEQRIAQSVEKALKESFGELEINILNHEELGTQPFIHYSEHMACFDCKISFEALEPLSFSFNSPKGACAFCDGLGIRWTLDMKKVVDSSKTINDGAIRVFYGFNKSYYFKMLKAFCQADDIDMSLQFDKLPDFQQKAILHGSATTFKFSWKRHRLNRKWDGIIKIAYDMIKDEKDRTSYMIEKVCDSCGGDRLNKSSSNVKVANKYIRDILNMPILTGVLYVLDEPSIGLHERDTKKLIKTLKSLRDKGNTVIVVEHDKETMNEADHIVDIGPLAGKYGGQIVFNGDMKKLLKSNTTTALYLNGTKDIRYFYRRPQQNWIKIKNVNINNIKNLDVDIPLQNFCAITGVSGSGKSSLILQTILPVAKEILNHAKKVTKIDGVTIDGLEQLDKVIYLDQSAIGRTPRSNPATYTSVMDDLRKLFSETKEAKLRGYGIGRFSFNVKGGRCEKCQGEGENKIEMHFLPDIMVKCESCHGARYNDQTIQIKYKTKSISDVLSMSVDEAILFFDKIPKLKNKLQTLMDVGLGYITLGQNATTLSGGEAQRIKLSKELSKKETGKTLYILDEPTTGLHFADVDRLTSVLHHLVELGNSVVVIEHNLDIIKNADWIIDMGPDGGDKGGKIVDSGDPEYLASNHKKSKSQTGLYLKKELQASKDSFKAS
ncbi:MAG: excinuclease ABC subunit A [Campylobacteraceae bacterium 4484_166]|nr:MAG: excinuclease ABC subunit A [Campylobacteraceae bacterium 4484_166]